MLVFYALEDRSLDWQRAERGADRRHARRPIVTALGEDVHAIAKLRLRSVPVMLDLVLPPSHRRFLRGFGQAESRKPETSPAWRPWILQEERWRRD